MPEPFARLPQPGLREISGAALVPPNQPNAAQRPTGSRGAVHFHRRRLLNREGVRAVDRKGGSQPQERRVQHAGIGGV